MGVWITISNWLQVQCSRDRRRLGVKEVQRAEETCFYRAMMVRSAIRVHAIGQGGRGRGQARAGRGTEHRNRARCREDVRLAAVACGWRTPGIAGRARSGRANERGVLPPRRGWF